MVERNYPVFRDCSPNGRFPVDEGFPFLANSSAIDENSSVYHPQDLGRNVGNYYHQVRSILNSILLSMSQGHSMTKQGEASNKPPLTQILHLGEDEVEWQVSSMWVEGMVFLAKQFLHTEVSLSGCLHRIIVNSVLAVPESHNLTSAEEQEHLSVVTQSHNAGSQHQSVNQKVVESIKLAIRVNQSKI